jgi:plasmid stabilization system protein ParE
MFKVLLAEAAKTDLARLFDSVFERELMRDGGDPDPAEQAINAIEGGLKLLERLPFTCRKVGASSFIRELVIPFGHTGYVALFEIVDDKTVLVAAVRHQREEDYH